MPEQFADRHFSQVPRDRKTDDQSQFEGGRYRTTEDEYYSNMNAINNRLEKLEDRHTKVLDMLSDLAPKINHIHGFTVHGAPHLATKEDLSKTESSLLEKIGERPKTTTFLALFALAAAVLALPFFSEWWGHVKSTVGAEGPAV